MVVIISSITLSPALTCTTTLQEGRRSCSRHSPEFGPHKRPPRRHTRRPRRTTRRLLTPNHTPHNTKLILNLQFLKRPRPTRQRTIPRRRAIKRLRCCALGNSGWDRVVARGRHESRDLGGGG